MAEITPRELFDDLQDQIVAMRIVVEDGLRLIHGLAPGEYTEALRHWRLLAQDLSAGRPAKVDRRMQKLHCIVRDTFERGAKPRSPDE